VQAVYFFVTGADLVEISRLSHNVIMGTLGRIQSVSVPLSAGAGPEERSAALKEIKERLAAAGESACDVAIKWRDQLLSTGLVAAEGRRTPSSPYETIKPREFCDLRFAGPHAANAGGDIVLYDVRMSGWGLWRARQQAIVSADMAPFPIESANVPSGQLPPHALPERSYAALGMRLVPEPNPIPLIEAIHDLRLLRNVDLRAATSEMIDLLATGQMPISHALIDGVPAKIDPRWWWAGAIEYPNSSAVFRLIVDGGLCLTDATEIALDRSAWEGHLSRIAATQHDGGPFPHWDNTARDRPVRLLDAIKLWSPQFGQALDELAGPEYWKWRSADDIAQAAQQRQRARMMYDHLRQPRCLKEREAPVSQPR
jgi:hypothetical protein